MKDMKRRDFLKSMSAAASLPAMPSFAMANTSGTPVIAADLMTRATKWAGLWKSSSASMLKHQFKLDEQAAQALFKKLVSSNVIGAPNAQGMSRVLVQTYPSKFVAAKMQHFAAQKAMASAPKPVTTVKPVKTVPKTATDQSSLVEKLKRLETTIDDQVDAELNDDLLVEDTATNDKNPDDAQKPTE